VDIARIVAELKQQRARLSRAIVALEAPNRPVARRAAGNPNKRRTRRLSAAGRARLSEMMKKRWVEAKKKKKHRL
jgi:hypothetical protein